MVPKFQLRRTGNRTISPKGEQDETAKTCRDRNGNSNLRDTETMSLKESIENYLEHKVRSHLLLDRSTLSKNRYVERILTLNKTRQGHARILKPAACFLGEQTCELLPI